MKKQFLSVFGVVLTVTLTLLSGIIHGRMSNRWGPSPDLAAAGEKLKNFPEEFGSWRRVSSEEMSDDAVNILECAGYSNGTYVNQQTGETVRMSLLVGPSQPISLHTPEICFSSRDYTQDGPAQPITIANADGSLDEFRALTFRSNNLTGNLRVYYAWSSGTHWSLEESRWTVGRHPYLYKIQLASGVPSGAKGEQNDPCLKFLRDFVLIPRSDWSNSTALVDNTTAVAESPMQ